MAQQVLAFIYGENENSWNAGIEMGFPSVQVVFMKIAPMSMGAATVNSKIRVISPNGPYINQPEFYTDRTVAQLVTASNA